MLIYRKSFEELEQEAIQNLSKTKIRNTNEGSRALSITKAINTMIQKFYNDLDFSINSAFISRASGGFIDLIGELLNCSRIPGESDDNYRYRVVNNIQVVAGGNKKALEIETLNIPGVKKIVLKNFTRGIGSFSAYVITNTADELEGAINEVQNILDNKTSFGIRAVAEAPRILNVSLSMNLVFKSNTPPSSRSSIRLETRRRVKAMIDSLDMGEALIASRLFQEIRNVNSAIEDVIINGLTIGSKSVLVANYSPYWDEKLFIRHIDDIEAF